jgi:hypothetical protein
MAKAKKTSPAGVNHVNSTAISRTGPNTRPIATRTRAITAAGPCAVKTAGTGAIKAAGARAIKAAQPRAITAAG